VRFSDLAYLDAAVVPEDKAGQAVHVELKDFIIFGNDTSRLLEHTVR